jgi:hypothetical protein
MYTNPSVTAGHAASSAGVASVLSTFYCHSCRCPRLGSVLDSPGVPVDEERPVFVHVGRRPVVQCLTCGHACILVDTTILHHAARDAISMREG